MSTGLPARWSGAVERAIGDGRGPTARALVQLAEGDRVRLGSVGAARAAQRLTGELLGLGPLADLVAEPAVTDVLVNGDGVVWVDRGEGLEAGAVTVADPRALATRLAGQARRRLDDAQPWVDGLLPSGVRLHAVLPPIVETGAHISLRVPRHHPRGVRGLVRLGAVCAPVAEVLADLLAARLAFVVSGGTGVGKTTLLGAMLGDCSPTERLVVVEDVRELSPGHPHVVHLQGRAPNVEGAGAVTMSDLVRQALRMRPDRLVVGEVRGPEVTELLAALNTGHEGGCGTLHANGVEEVPARIEALAALAGMPRAAVHAQLRGAVQVAVHVRRTGGRRHVAELGVLRAGPDGWVDVRVALRAWPQGDRGWRVERDLGWDELESLLRRTT